MQRRYTVLSGVTYSKQMNVIGIDMLSTGGPSYFKNDIRLHVHLPLLMRYISTVLLMIDCKYTI